MRRCSLAIDDPWPATLRVLQRTSDHDSRPSRARKCSSSFGYLKLCAPSQAERVLLTFHRGSSIILVEKTGGGARRISRQTVG